MKQVKLKKMLLVGAIIFVFIKDSSCACTIACFAKAPFIQLLSLYGIAYHSLDQVVADTQKQWLRPADKERWELESTNEARNTELFLLFNELGLIQPKMPQGRQYTYAVVLGYESIIGIRDRLHFLNHLWHVGIRFDSIVLLTGQRKLNDLSELHVLQQEGIDTSMLVTETDLMVFEFNRMNFDQELKKLPLVVVDTPAQPTASGILRRPNTADTVEHWIKQSKPSSGSCLVISTQPFCTYQHMVCSILLPASFSVETVGYVDAEQYGVAVYIDSVARTLYQYKYGKRIA